MLPKIKMPIMQIVAMLCFAGLAFGQSVDTFGPRLNDAETKIADLQKIVLEHETAISEHAQRLKALETKPVASANPLTEPVIEPTQWTEEYQPVVAYSPPVRYSQPVYSQPVVPSVTYGPTVTYSQPVVRYSQPVVNRPVFRAAQPLRRWVPQRAACYIDANGNRVCPQ